MLSVYALRAQYGQCIWKPSTRLRASPTRFWTRSFQTNSNASILEPFRILFMGRDEFSCLVFKELYNAKDVWREIVIATQPDVYVGRRGSVLSVSPLKLVGEELQIPVHAIPKIKKDFRHWTLPPPFSPSNDATGNQSHVLITASFGRILSEKMLSAFQPSHRLNVHPSLLPAYRGPAPIQHTIMNDETQTGVCVIQMLKKSEGIDAGPLWGCHEMPVAKDATFPKLRDELGVAGGKLLVTVLRDMLNNKAVAQPQPHAEDAPRAPMITAEDTLVDFNSMTAAHIYSKFRALRHQKPMFTHTPDARPLHLHDLVVLGPECPTLGSLVSEPGWTTFTKHYLNGTLMIRCAGGTVLGVRRVKPEGKSDRSAGDFWNGQRNLKVVGSARHLFLGQSKVP